MQLPVTLFIALRYLRGRPADRFARFVSMLSTLGILLGVMALVAVLSVMNGFEQQMERNTLQFLPHAVITSDKGSINPQEFPISDSQIANITQSKLVQSVQPITQANVVLQSSSKLSTALMLGISQEQPEPLIEHFYKVSADALKPGEYQAVLGANLAYQLGVTTGDQIRILVPSVSQITPMGRIPSQRLFTVAGIFYAQNEADSTHIIVDQQDAARLLRYPAGNITGWRLFMHSPLDIGALAALPIEPPFKLIDWRERKGELFQAVRMEKNMMGLLLSLIIAVAAFNIITSLSLIVMEKQGEVAILQTQGLTKRQILTIFMLQGASSGVIGAILGALLGVGLASQINSIPVLGQMIVGGNLPIVIDSSQILMITLIAILIALSSTFYPAWRAASVEPAQALRYE